MRHEELLKSAVLRYDNLSLQHSRLVKAFRQCNRCPLGERTKVLIQNKKENIITIPAICSYYEKNSRSCPVDIDSYVSSLKEYYNVVDSPEYIEEMGKFLLKNAVSDAVLARDIEVIEKGAPGFKTNLHEERAAKIFDSIVKLKIGGEKHLHVHNDMADRLVEQVMGHNIFRPIIDRQKKVDEFDDVVEENKQ